MKVLDIGCGWGGFAKYAAEKYDASVSWNNRFPGASKIRKETSAKGFRLKSNCRITES